MPKNATMQKIMSQLTTFGMKQVAPMIPDLIDQAAAAQLTHKEFLSAVLDAEVSGRNEKRRKRNHAGAHFPPNIKPLEMFDPAELESGITRSQISQLKELDCLVRLNSTDVPLTQHVCIG